MAQGRSNQSLKSLTDGSSAASPREPASFDVRQHINDAAIASSINAIAMAGLDGKLFYVNQAFVNMWRLNGPQEALGRTADEFWERPQEALVVMGTLRKQGFWQGELLARLADGGQADVQLSAHVVKDPAGQPVALMASFVDITAQNQMARALKQERDFAASLVETAPVIILVLDLRGFIQHVNPFFERLTGYRLNEVRGKDWFATFLPERDRDRIRELFREASHDVPTRGNANAILIRNGQERLIEWNDQVMRDADGQPMAVLAIGQDVTRRHATERALEQSERLYRTLAQVAPVGIFHTDPAGRCTYVNDQWCEIAGQTRDAATHTGWLETLHRDDRLRVLEEWTLATMRRRPFISEFRFQHPDGQVRWVMAQAKSQTEALTGPEVSGYVGTATDITESKLNEAEIRRLAFFDPLTNLPNRRLLLDRLQHAQATSARDQRRGALLYLDLDNFKTLNDTLGHDKGDLLLQQVAQRLLGSVREGDTVTRLGGDEFVVLLEGLDERPLEAATQIETVSGKIIAACHEPYRLGDTDYHSTLSIGAAVFKGHQLAIEELMRRADLAMYEAKAAGRNTFRLYAPDDGPGEAGHQPV
jgi:diguanylate cyclase (GGDEF)-like protein/PAS domain S-box-containing protein